MLQPICAFVHGTAWDQLWLDPSGRRGSEGVRSTQSWSCCLFSEAMEMLQARKHYKLHKPTSETWLKKKKLLSFLQARIGHTVHGLYAAQRMRNPPWIKVEQRLCQLLARAMHSQCPLSLGVALERGENLSCLQDGERWKQWDCMAFLFIPCQFLKIWKCLKVIPRHGRKEVVSQQLGKKTQGRIYVFIKESCCSTMASNVFPVLLTIKRLWIHLNREGTLGRMNACQSQTRGCDWAETVLSLTTALLASCESWHQGLLWLHQAVPGACIWGWSLAKPGPHRVEDESKELVASRRYERRDRLSPFSRDAPRARACIAKSCI